MSNKSRSGKGRYLYADKTFEYSSERPSFSRKARPLNLWAIVPRPCGNCAETYHSRQCKRKTCSVKRLERRGMEAVR